MLKKYHLLTAFLCIASFLPLSLQAFIYEIKVLRKLEPKTNTYKYFIGLSDFHDKTDKNIPAQLKSLTALLKNVTDKKNCKIIVEDLSSSNGSCKGSCRKFYINSQGGILGGLAKKCRSMGFAVDNIEYRYCRVAALGPVINNLALDNLHTLPSAATIQVHDLTSEVDAATQEVHTYPDSDTLKKAYKSELKEVTNQLHTFKKKEHANLTVADFLHGYSNKQTRLELLKTLLTFDSCLLDFKMVNAVINDKKHHKFLAVAGGSHITRVCTFLEKTGYEQVYATTVTFHKEYNLKKCIGATMVNGNHCVVPKIITLDELKKYL